MLHNSRPKYNSTDRRSGASPALTAGAAVRQSLIDELESVVASRNIGSRADVLRRVTDLFVAGSDRYDAEQMALFDDIMSRLIVEIESSARIAFGQRLSKTDNAPPKVSAALALDDSIEVAAPLLMHSNQLDDDTLVKGAKNKSQQHLLAISRRRMLSESVTDVLVERGNPQVVVSTAANSGAQFSEFGYSTLIMRSKSDDDLALTVWSRSELSREHLLALFASASEAVRQKLEVIDRAKVALVDGMLRQASDQVQARSREHSPEFAAAQVLVQSLRQSRSLTEDRLCEFIAANKFDEITVALSLLSDLPIGAIERALVHDNYDQVLLIAKFIDLSLDSTRAILVMLAKSKNQSIQELEECLTRFKKLKPETARTAIQFYRLRERATKSAPK
jgi:uncharacterized protein (DUF2336 family)